MPQWEIPDCVQGCVLCVCVSVYEENVCVSVYECVCVCMGIGYNVHRIISECGCMYGLCVNEYM